MTGELVITKSERLGVIQWRRYDIELIVLPHVPHLLLVQGASLQDLFAPKLLLRADVTELWQVPCKIKNVVFADVLELEKDQLPLQDVVLELMREVLK